MNIPLKEKDIPQLLESGKQEEAWCQKLKWVLSDLEEPVGCSRQSFGGIKGKR